jgi:23S rRNA pseudouridine955/2504/2580 synthase
MLSQKAEAGDDSLNDWLIEYLLENGEITTKSLETYRPSICNRLDRNTSGLVVCGKTLAGSRKMNELIRDRSVRKFYRTIVVGRLSDKLTIKGYLFKNEKTNKVIISDKPEDDRYSYIETAYEPVKYNKDLDMTLLEVELITGKTHQIRAHLSSVGHAIIGDVKYGGPKFRGINSQLLHSYRLEFPEGMEGAFDRLSGRVFIADLPKEFKLL